MKLFFVSIVMKIFLLLAPIFLAGCTNFSHSPMVEIRGRVIDVKGKPVPQVTVVLRKDVSSSRFPLPVGTQIVLDNEGGYSHVGRRLHLLKGGDAVEISYTDALGFETSRKARWHKQGKNIILEIPSNQNRIHREILTPVKFGLLEYWVMPKDATRLRDSTDTRAFQQSLRRIYPL